MGTMMPGTPRPAGRRTSCWLYCLMEPRWAALLTTEGVTDIISDCNLVTSTHPLQNTQSVAPAPWNTPVQRHHNTRLNAGSSRMFGLLLLIEKHRTKTLLSAEKKESGSNKDWNVGATANATVTCQDVQNVHEWDKKEEGQDRRRPAAAGATCPVTAPRTSSPSPPWTAGWLVWISSSGCRCRS